MTQLAGAKPTRQRTTGPEWWSLTVRPSHKDQSDAVIGDVVTPLAAQALCWGAQRWFFTRCMDPEAPSIQLRILGDPTVLNRAQSLLLALVNQAVPALGPVETEEHREAGSRHEGGPGAVSSRSEADLAKYGGPEGLSLAEDVFELSSDLAAWATSRFPKTSGRSSLAALLLFDATHARMRGPRASAWPDRRSISWDYYWDSHLRSCTAASGQRAAHMRSALTSQLAPRVLPAHRLMAATASEPAVDNWRKRWSRTIDTYLYRADKARVSRSAQHLTVYQSRLMLNRLGLSVRDEAGLGLYARSWSRERETDFLASIL